MIASIMQYVMVKTIKLISEKLKGFTARSENLPGVNYMDDFHFSPHHVRSSRGLRCAYWGYRITTRYVILTITSLPAYNTYIHTITLDTTPDDTTCPTMLLEQ